jgi:ABC-2 type transport system ATP-binding protein
VNDVTFLARQGEVTGYLGPNGSGKSTTMKILTGLLEPTRGEVVFDGRPIRDNILAFKSRVGYVPEEPHLYSHLSGLEYLQMVAGLRDLPRRIATERVDGLLTLLSLHGDRHVPVSAYSKGMRQKVLLAAALLHNQAVEERGENAVWLKVGPMWDPLRSDPRFAGLLRRLNLAP